MNRVGKGQREKVPQLRIGEEEERRKRRRGRAVAGRMELEESERAGVINGRQ